LNYLEGQNNSNRAVIGMLQILSYPDEYFLIPMLYLIHRLEIH
jgi:hypothetical protein